MLKLICTGNVGKDPESRADQNGNVFVTFTIAVSGGTKQNPRTTWLEVSCNGKLAETVTSYVTKGMKLLVEGYPACNAYINKENKAVGTMRVYANTIEFLSSKSENTNNSDVDNMRQDLQSDDVPF